MSQQRELATGAGEVTQDLLRLGRKGRQQSAELVEAPADHEVPGQ